MNNTLPELIHSYVQDEWNDYIYYSQLAEKVKTAEQRNMMLEFAQDECRHAQSLAAYYCHLTGRYPYIGPYQPKPIPNDLEQVFLARVIAESGDIKKYKKLHLSTRDPWLRDITFDAMMDETQHSVRLLYLAEQAD